MRASARPRVMKARCTSGERARSAARRGLVAQAGRARRRPLWSWLRTVVSALSPLVAERVNLEDPNRRGDRDGTHDQDTDDELDAGAAGDGALDERRESSLPEVRQPCRPLTWREGTHGMTRVPGTHLPPPLPSSLSPAGLRRCDGTVPKCAVSVTPARLTARASASGSAVELLDLGRQPAGDEVRVKRTVFHGTAPRLASRPSPRSTGLECRAPRPSYFVSSGGLPAHVRDRPFEGANQVGEAAISSGALRRAIAAIRTALARHEARRDGGRAGCSPENGAGSPAPARSAALDRALTATRRRSGGRRR